MNKFLPKQLNFGWYMTSIEAQIGLDDTGHITKKQAKVKMLKFRAKKLRLI